jgi:hypothetical protein
MSTNFPTSKDTSTTLPTEASSTPLATNHVTAHQNLADSVIALETKVGVDSSAVTTTLDFKLSGIPSGDKAVSLTGTEALTNKTLTAPKINLGSDADEDIYKRSGGVLVRLAKGSANQLLGMDGTGTTLGYQAVSGVTTDEKAAIAGTSGTPSSTNKFVTNNDTEGTGNILRSSQYILPFGDGNDGTVVFDGSTTILGMAPSSSIYTLTRDFYFDTVTVNNGVTIETSGYRIFAKTLLSNAGTIKRTPNNGTNASGTTKGSGGAALAAGTIYGGLAGKDGADGISSTGTANGTNGTNSDAQTSSIASIGGAGGNGGPASGVSTGTGGTAGGKTDALGKPHTALVAYSLGEFLAGTYTQLKSGTGGGSGASGALNSGSAGTTGAGGGGGSSGGIVFISAKTLTNTGTISANGGNGGTGSNMTGAVNRGSGGGGGGGGGGAVILISRTLTLGTVTVVGGTGRLGGTTANAASDGVNGTTGIIYNISS